MNPYLTSLTAKYDAVKTTIEGYQSRAVDANRDLTAEELRSVQEQGDIAKGLAEQIAAIKDIENRNAEVAKATAETVETRSGATTQDRDPGHYRSESEGGRHSFFADLVQARTGDQDAASRLAEHNRALNTGGAGAGIVPPKWLASEYAELARQGRRVANAVRNLPLGNDPRPFILPKQIGGASVSDQPSENTPGTYTDAFETDTDTVVPKTVIGGQTVSRQLLDSASPAVDALIYSDLLADYNTQVESRVIAAMLASTGAPVATLATEAAFKTGAVDAVIDTALSVRADRKAPADITVMDVARWGAFKKLRDADGRPLIPAGNHGPTNVFGVGSVDADGEIEGLAALVSDGMAPGYPASVLVARASDTLLWESGLRRFRFEEINGPESIKLAVFGYVAVHVRYAGSSVKRFVVTAA